MIKIIYSSLEPSVAELRFLAQEDYENGRIVDAVDNFSKLSQCCENDFSVFLSLGIISLFHEKDKEKALEYFNKAIEIVKSQSDFYTILLCYTKHWYYVILIVLMKLKDFQSRR